MVGLGVNSAVYCAMDPRRGNGLSPGARVMYCPEVSKLAIGSATTTRPHPVLRQSAITGTPDGWDAISP